MPFQIGQPTKTFCEYTYTRMDARMALLGRLSQGVDLNTTTIPYYYNNYYHHDYYYYHHDYYYYYYYYY